MTEEWKNTVIETGVDTLLNYLAENQEAAVEEISEDMGVSEDRIKEWAEALESSGFLEKSYSARKGMVLKYTQQNKEEAEKRLEELRNEVEEETENIKEEMDSRTDEVQEAREKLKEMAEELDENREEEEEIKDRLEELDEFEDKIESRLEELEKEKKEAHHKSVNLISRIDSSLEKIDQAEEKADRFEEKKDSIRKKVKALKKLEKHAEKAEEVEEKLEDLEKDEEKAKSLFQRFQEKLSGLMSSDVDKSYEKILSGTVKEAKQAISSLENPDYGKLLEIEKENKNRGTLIEWLERRQDE